MLVRDLLYEAETPIGIHIPFDQASGLQQIRLFMVEMEGYGVAVAQVHCNQVIMSRNLIILKSAQSSGDPGVEEEQGHIGINALGYRLHPSEMIG